MAIAHSRSRIATQALPHAGTPRLYPRVRRRREVSLSAIILLECQGESDFNTAIRVYLSELFRVGARADEVQVFVIDVVDRQPVAQANLDLARVGRG